MDIYQVLVCLLGKQSSFRFSWFLKTDWLRMASFSLIIFCRSHLLTAHWHIFSNSSSWGWRWPWGSVGFSWVAMFCSMHILSLGGESMLCLLSKVQQFRIMDRAVIQLGFRNHLPNYPSSFDLPNLLTHSLIIIFIRNDWQWIKAEKNR